MPEKVVVAEVLKLGDKLIIPEACSYKDALRLIKDKMEYEEQEVQLSEIIDSAFPWDGAHALLKVLERKHGLVMGKAIRTFFGDIPPEIRTIASGPDGQTVQIPWGQMEVPGIEGKITTGAAAVRGRLAFVLGGLVKRKHAEQFQQLGQEIREYLKHTSLYRGRIFNIRFHDEAGKVLKPEAIEPNYIGVNIDPTELVLERNIERFWRCFLAHIKYSDQARELQVPGKLGALLAGAPGTGKTMALMIASQLAASMGVTCIYVNNFADFEPATRMAVQYQPALVIMEDLDRLIEDGDSKAISKIQNILDGIESKGADVRLVFTTNYPERLTNTIIRPGRIDLLVPFEPPDAFAAEKLLRQYGRGLIQDSTPLTQVRKLLSGQIAAVIRNTVEIAKLSALDRAEGDLHGLDITEDDLLFVAEHSKQHMALVNRKEKKEDSDLVKAAKTLIGGFHVIKHSHCEQEGGGEHGGLLDTGLDLMGQSLAELADQMLDELDGPGNGQHKLSE